MSLLSSINVHVPMCAEYGQIIQMDGIEYHPDTILLDGDWSLVQKADGRLHVSGVIEPQRIVDRVRQLLGGGKVAAVWHGYRPRIVGGMPLVGRMPGWKNLLVALGHGRNGYLLAPSTAEMIVHALLSTTDATTYGKHTPKECAVSVLSVL